MQPLVAARRATRRAITGRGLLKALARGLIGLVLVAGVYVALVQAGIVRSALFPRIDGDIAAAHSDRPGLRVLFVGNSFTYYNSMPAMVRELALADEGAGVIFTVEYTAPNWSLRDAAESDGLADAIEDVRWDVVVLQEVSYYLSASAEERRRVTHPYARALQRQIAVSGAQTMLFMTWGYRDGSFDGDSFAWMQARLEEGYSELGEELFAPVVPVGLAWSEALARRPDLELWKRDGRHPSRLGSYLAACVFYAVLSGRDPTGNSFTAGLDEGDARFLQEVAAQVVADERAAVAP
jgi:hypothetical protein